MAPRVFPEEPGEQGRTLFEFAAEQQAVVMAHSGEALSQPLDFVPFANTFESVALILAHLGNSGTGTRADLQVRVLQEARHGNVYVDTSSARSLMPGLVEWAVRQVGADRLLYGTDSPLYFAPRQRARIECADLTPAEKRMSCATTRSGCCASCEPRATRVDRPLTTLYVMCESCENRRILACQERGIQSAPGRIVVRRRATLFGPSPSVNLVGVEEEDPPE